MVKLLKSTYLISNLILLIITVYAENTLIIDKVVKINDKNLKIIKPYRHILRNNHKTFKNKIYNNNTLEDNNNQHVLEKREIQRGDIFKNTKWNDVGYIEDVPSSLSLISQGKYDERLINSYDNSYYYPASLGKGIDIYLFSRGFYFGDISFSSNERISKCAVNITQGQVKKLKNEKQCYVDIKLSHIGSAMADVTAGEIYGVASKANIYGIYIDDKIIENLIAGLNYIKNSMFRPYKTIIQLPEVNSNSSIFHSNKSKLQDIINDLSNKGAVFITGVTPFNRGNKNSYEVNKNEYPCAFDNVICVGGIDNKNGITEARETTGGKVREIMKTEDYRRVNTTGYGTIVDIYAPYYAKNVIQEPTTYYQTHGTGTGFSAAIVSGVAATIMSNYSNTKYNTKVMLDHLKKVGLWNIIADIPKGQNLFINNGKHVVYSKDNIYHGCGPQSGNKVCKNGQCCTKDGYCKNETQDVCKTSKGCQSDYGKCKIVTSTTEGKCGDGYGNCHSGYCCSYKNYCGKNSNYCGLGCQNSFGRCDN